MVGNRSRYKNGIAVEAAFCCHKTSPVSFQDHSNLLDNRPSKSLASTLFSIVSPLFSIVTPDGYYPHALGNPPCTLISPTPDLSIQILPQLCPLDKSGLCIRVSSYYPQTLSLNWSRFLLSRHFNISISTANFLQKPLAHWCGPQKDNPCYCFSTNIYCASLCKRLNLLLEFQSCNWPLPSRLYDLYTHLWNLNLNTWYVLCAIGRPGSKGTNFQ